MTEHNHRRGTRGPRDRQVGVSVVNKALLSDRHIGASGGGPHYKFRHHGESRSKAGAKKYVRSRTRFHENAATRELAGQENIAEA